MRWSRFVAGLAITAITAVTAALVAGCASGGQPSPTPSDTPAVEATTSRPPLGNALKVTSDAFKDGGTIPAEFTCRGGGKVPTISWTGDLNNAKAIAVVVDDPDAPGGIFVHRVVVDLPTTSTSLGETPAAPAHQAVNSAGQTGWTPPCPPSGTHHYRFTVYALESPTGLPDGASSADARAAIDALAVAKGQLTGLVASG